MWKVPPGRSESQLSQFSKPGLLTSALFCCYVCHFCLSWRGGQHCITNCCVGVRLLPRASVDIWLFQQHILLLKSFAHHNHVCKWTIILRYYEILLCALLSYTVSHRMEWTPWLWLVLGRVLSWSDKLFNIQKTPKLKHKRQSKLKFCY